jgi:hypothetical protein
MYGQACKLLLDVASTVNLSSGTHNHNFVRSKTFECFEMGPLVSREEESDNSWSLPLYCSLLAYWGSWG